MPINFTDFKKENFAFLFKIKKNIQLFLLILIPSLFFSCFFNNHKDELSNITNDLMINISNGDFSAIPGLSDAINQLDDKAADDMVESFKNLGKWKIDVGDINNNCVLVTVEILDEVKNNTLNFYFKRYKDGWNLEKDISISHKINFIPLIEKRD